MEKKGWREELREIIKKSYFILGRTGRSGVVNMLEDFMSEELDKAREEGDIASDFLYWHPLGGGMPDSSIRIGVEFEVGGCYEDWGFVIEQNGRTISSGRTLKEAISKLKDSK